MVSGRDAVYELLGIGNDKETKTPNPELPRPEIDPELVPADVTVTGCPSVNVDVNYETHVFSEPGTGTLEFSDGREELHADYLIVAGGGCSGGDHTNTADFAGGTGAGGDAWVPDESAAWITAATQTEAFSRGGTGGHSSAASGGTADLNYGDGGSAGKNSGMAGAAGQSGVVVIRFLRGFPFNLPPETPAAPLCLSPRRFQIPAPPCR